MLKQHTTELRIILSLESEILSKEGFVQRVYGQKFWNKLMIKQIQLKPSLMQGEHYRKFHCTLILENISLQRFSENKKNIVFKLF